MKRVTRSPQKNENVSPVKRVKPNSPCKQEKCLTIQSPRKRYERFIVKEVNYDYYPCAGEDNWLMAKILHLLNERDQSERYVHLRDDWVDSTVNVGDYVHVIGNFDEQSKSCIIDNDHNLIIVNPDYLCSATQVSDSTSCMRKAVLEERAKLGSPWSPSAVFGNMLHELLQTCLENDNFTYKFLQESMLNQIAKSTEQLFCAGLDEKTAKAELESIIPRYISWSEKFVAATPQSGATINPHRASSTDNTVLCINKILDIEEHVWSPMYGLKGMIDASIQAEIIQNNKSRRLVLPFELKTTRTSTVAYHHAQTIYYTLLMNDRYDVNVKLGLLYYVREAEDGEMRVVPVRRHELVHLIIQRNEMAAYVSNRNRLPPMIQNSYKCGKCFAKSLCFAVENGNGETSGLGQLFDDATAHMTGNRSEFFVKWEKLISAEENDMIRFRKEIWSMLANEREFYGRCLSNMKLDPDSIEDNGRGAGSRRYKCRFWRHNSDDRLIGLGHFAVGDPIVISSQDGHYALAIGFVYETHSDSILVDIDRKLRGIPKRCSDFDEETCQNFEGIRVIKRKSQPFSRLGQQNGVMTLRISGRDDQKIRDSKNETLYRIDKDEMSSGMSLVRENLVKLMMIETEERRRQLIVDMLAPEFHAESRYSASDTSDDCLNVDQKQAVDKVLRAKDYLLILGMPGSGKTTTIAHIVKTLVTQGKTVLLTSYTHTAVDNILLKLHDSNSNIDILRLGSRDKVHPGIHKYMLSRDGSIEHVDELAEFVMSKPVVATTCLGINHWLFHKRRFDYCIVDEASQITLPACLGPLRHADMFVLVGDHYQLPPLVRNSEARKKGMSVSLFKTLSEAHPEAVVNLQHQYRMNKDIMLLSNQLIYDNKLRCGSPEVAERCLTVPYIKKIDEFHVADNEPFLCDGQKCWLRQLVSPERRAVFVDTDSVPAFDSRTGDVVHNEIEAQLVYQVTTALLACGVEESSIGIISVYRSQLRLLSQLLRGHSQLEISTVDKYQGRDKECILVSLVRSNEKQAVGELLRDWRRINVAFTRAQSKLVIFGSRSTLAITPIFSQFLTLMDKNNWIYVLPKDAHKMHVMARTTLSKGKQQLENLGGEGKSPRKIVKGAGRAILKDRKILRDVSNGLL
ncbi:4276_t:CDS:10 [Paraglomus brasilianum]|uniref:DNA replication ATP-dependent helicase/nuclease n=1 Tax=Paraglomus brasilianum TaxID=144538 RepID=A0A9N9GAW4_9GLOM|nr:4276_t:CDS:10 [Paraglomus brasilianum]